MLINRSNAGAKTVAFAVTEVGKPYSEDNPSGSYFNGQDWDLGKPLPTYYDCDGFAFVSCLAGAGIRISNGTAAAQWIWAQMHGLVVADTEPLLPGDVCAFWGATGGPDNAGHTGIVRTTTTLVNAYDSAHGVCVIPFTRFQPNNGSNGLGWIGAYRPSLLLPPMPPAPIPPEVPVEFIAQGPSSAASFLYDTQTKTRRGLADPKTSPDTIKSLEAIGIKNYGATIPKTFLALFTAEPNFD